jgi:hypothetical protein
MASKHEPDVQTKGLHDAPSSADLSAPDSSTLKPWEKPGLLGSTRRGLRTFQRYVWDDPDKPKEERWFLLKLDIFLLTVSCLGYFSKNLDQSNINNAYVSGVSMSQLLSDHAADLSAKMKESLNMKGSELTYAGNCFTAGYVIGQMPAVMLATRVRPSILIPTLEILWSIMTFCTSSISNTSQLYAIRFLIGLCESGYFPVMIVSSKRVCRTLQY